MESEEAFALKAGDEIKKEPTAIEESDPSANNSSDAGVDCNNVKVKTEVTRSEGMIQNCPGNLPLKPEKWGEDEYKGAVTSDVTAPTCTNITKDRIYMPQGHRDSRLLSLHADPDTSLKSEDTESAECEASDDKSMQIPSASETSSSQIKTMSDAVRKFKKKGSCYSCTRCSYIGDKRQTTRHWVMKHLPREEAPYVCNHCAKISVRIEEMSKHFDEKHTRMDMLTGVGGTRCPYRLKPSDVRILSREESIQIYAGLPVPPPNNTKAEPSGDEIMSMLKLHPKLMEQVRQMVQQQKYVDAQKSPLNSSTITIQPGQLSLNIGTTPLATNILNPSSPCATSSNLPRRKLKSIFLKKSWPATKSPPETKSAEVRQKEADSHDVSANYEGKDESGEAEGGETAKYTGTEKETPNKWNENTETTIYNSKPCEATATNEQIITSSKQTEKRHLQRMWRANQARRRVQREVKIPKKDTIVKTTNALNSSRSRKRRMTQDTFPGCPKQKRNSLPVASSERVVPLSTVADLLKNVIKTTVDAAAPAIISAVNQQCMSQVEDFGPISDQFIATNTSLSQMVRTLSATISENSEFSTGIDDMAKAVSSLSTQVAQMSTAVTVLNEVADDFNQHVTEQTGAMRSLIQGSIDGHGRLTSAAQSQSEAFQRLQSTLTSIMEADSNQEHE